MLKLPLTNSFISDIVIKMDNLIRIYDNVISSEKCDYFVNKFEAHSELHEVQNNSRGKTLTMMNLMNSANTPFRNDLNFLGNLFMENVEKYKHDCQIHSLQFPKEFGVEAFKIKRYLPNTTDEFPEQGNHDNGRRQVVQQCRKEKSQNANNPKHLDLVPSLNSICNDTESLMGIYQFYNGHGA